MSLTGRSFRGSWTWATYRGTGGAGAVGRCSNSLDLGRFRCLAPLLITWAYSSLGLGTAFRLAYKEAGRGGGTGLPLLFFLDLGGKGGGCISNELDDEGCCKLLAVATGRRLKGSNVMLS